MTDIQIHPILQGKWNERDVISAYGHALMIIDPIPKDQSIDGTFILVEDNNYFLEIGISNNAFFIKRNSDIISYPLEQINKELPYTCLAVWDPENIHCSVTEDRIYSSADASTNLNIIKNFKSMKTKTTLPPFSLIDFCKERIGQNKTKYENEAEFFSTMISLFQNIQDNIDFSNSRDAFWETVIEDGNKTRKPRFEEKNQNLIHGLLYNMKTVKSFELISGPNSGGGELDFLLIGDLKSGKKAKVCVEFKNAHSSKLEHGLIKQLPEYMKLNSTDLGIYMIFNFKDEEYPHPQKSENELDFELSKKVMNVGFEKIRILFANFGKIPTPSKIP